MSGTSGLRYAFSEIHSPPTPRRGTGHVCRRSSNPRKGNYCDCGKPVELSAEAKPIRRDTRLESQIIENATRGLLDPAQLIGHCHARAGSHHLTGEYVDDPMTIRPHMDRKLEIREELVDAINHALFEMQCSPGEIGGELWHDMEIVIRGAAILYDRLQDE